jgi:hypothetical protein
MTEKTERNPLQIIGLIILKSPSLIFRFGIEAFRFKSKANKAARIFRNELQQQGLDTATAQRLTAHYLEGSDPFILLRALR